MRTQDSGFTLLEAVMAIAVMAAVVIAAPPLFKWLNRQGVGHGVEQLRSDLQLARMMAINRKQSCAIVLNAPAVNNYQNSLSQKVVSLDGYRGNVRFLDAGPDGGKPSSQIVFNRQGMSDTAAPRDVFLADERRQSIYRIRVMMPGGISVYRWTGERWQ